MFCFKQGRHGQIEFVFLCVSYRGKDYNSVQRLSYCNAMVTASLNVNSLVHLDETKCLVQEKGIHILA